MSPAKVTLAGWGRFPRVETRLVRPGDAPAVTAAVAAPQAAPLIARGLGRSYGDAAASPGTTLDLTRLDRMLAFDPVTGQLVAEAGVRLADIIAAFLPRGWFPRVTPGTRFVTLGGMIAADVHGKNHHAEGGMSGCLDWIELLGADGTVRRLTPADPLFAWTCGGMGLTGVILRAALRLRPVESAWIRQKTVAAPDLDRAMAAFEAGQNTLYSVAWIDCLASGADQGRALVMFGDHAPRAGLDNRRRARPFHIPPARRLAVPFDLPGLTLNRWTVRAFNAAYWWKGRRAPTEQLVDWRSYFYPLDGIQGWNRIYGRRGLAQYQCVLPLDSSAPGLRRLLSEIAAAGQGSFLAVLKRMGPAAGGLSFPMEGYTLALDFPVNPASLALMDRLDAITLDHGGRVYLAKDARMSAATLAASDPRLAAFHALRDAADPGRRFGSALSERLQL